jgi:Lrp/AsnC family leucine-responsive transcriptional regulator
LPGGVFGIQLEDLMDFIDGQILKQLQQNARVSVSDVSAIVNLSVPAVSDRIKRLEASGVIQQYTTIISPSVLKKDLTAMMFVSLERPQFSEKFVSYVNTMDEILECHYLAGDYDYLLKIITENTGTLGDLLTKIKGIQGIQKTRTIVVLNTVKNNHSITPTENIKYEKGPSK